MIPKSSIEKKVDMETQKIIVVVEEVDAARTALQWALHNLFRYGDLITLLHVFPSSRSRNHLKQRNRRLRGFQLALSFKDLCNGVPEAKVEIVVMEGDQGATIVSLVRDIGASMLVVGLHDHSFLYKLTMANGYMSNLKCRVFAVKPSATMNDSPLNTNFSQVDMARIRVPEQKNLFKKFPNSLGSIWRSKGRRASS
eukprot:TRINITY_DN2614_c0_g1_i2.p1 TRINITY_DN2614_c0_g1~~TRINITY_DN2614_c0_g1_i2.p1  ORF type:complete len:197 (+),score=30.19 TRINITY_DN2614_c0_g1_i2:93-683(+)